MEGAANQGLVDRKEAELRILELKESQLEVMEKIHALNASNADFTGLGKVVGIGAEFSALRQMSIGSNPNAVPANFNQPFPNAGKVMAEQVNILKEIAKKLEATIKFAN